jgi:hypothetical protein
MNDDHTVRAREAAKHCSEGLPEVCFEVALYSEIARNAFYESPKTAEVTVKPSKGLIERGPI